MIRFVVCDDNEEIVKRTSEIINKIMIKTEIEYRINKFKGYTKSMINLINDKTDQKIYILDIELPTISGIEIASRIREKDWNSVIIFLTIHSECKNDVFSERLMVMDYISKLHKYEKRLEKDIKLSLKVIGQRNILTFKYCNIIYRLPHEEILYITSTLNKRCIIVTENGKQIPMLGTLKKLLKQLGPAFYLSHKSCIVNIEKIKNVNLRDDSITFNNGVKESLISKRNRKGIDEYVRNYR